MNEWITHCDRCRRPVKVSISPQERASTELYCESCFNTALETPEVPEPPPRQAPPPAAAPPALFGAPGETFVTCEACAGTGRVKLVLGDG